MAVVLASSLVVPVVDLSGKRTTLPEIISKACQEFGMFKVVNHRVSAEVIERLDKESDDFFSMPATEKIAELPLSNGDMGELEYLLLHTNNLPTSNLR